MPYVEGRVVHDADAHIMEWPTWLVDYAEPAVRERLQPRDRPTTVRAARSTWSGCGRSTPATEYRAAEAEPRSWPARTSRPPAASSPRTGPRALDLLGFASQLIFNTFHNGRFADARAVATPTSSTAPPGPTTGGWSSSARSTPACCPPATCRWPTSTGRRPWPAEAVEDGRGGAAGAVGLPGGPLAEPHRPRPGVGDRRRRPASRSCSTSAGEASCIDPDYFQNGLPIPPDFHGGEENFRSVDYMAIPGPPDADAGHDDLRRRARAVPRPQDRRDRAGRDLDAELDAPDGVGRRGLRAPRGAAAGAVAPAHRVRAAPDPGHAVPDRGRRAGSPSRSAPTSACSRRTTRTSRAAGGRSSASRPRLGDAADAVRQAFYCDNFVDLMGSDAGADRRLKRLQSGVAGRPIGSAVMPSDDQPRPPPPQRGARTERVARRRDVRAVPGRSRRR